MGKGSAVPFSSLGHSTNSHCNTCWDLNIKSNKQSAEQPFSNLLAAHSHEHSKKEKAGCQESPEAVTLGRVGRGILGNSRAPSESREKPRSCLQSAQ